MGLLASVETSELAVQIEREAVAACLATFEPSCAHWCWSVGTVNGHNSRLPGKPVVGDAGMGKTRLMLDFVATKGEFVLNGGRLGDADNPYSTFSRGLSVGLSKTGALTSLPPLDSPFAAP